MYFKNGHTLRSLPFSLHINPNKPFSLHPISSDSSQHSSFQHFQGRFGSFVLGSFLAGALAGAVDVSHRHAEGEVGLVGLTLSLQQVVHWSLAYPRSIFLQQTDGRLPGVHSQHLLNTVNRETQSHIEKDQMLQSNQTLNVTVFFK